MEKTYYKLYRIDVCASPYAIDYKLVGAESLEDLHSHWAEIFREENFVEEYMKNEDRITEITDAFTTTPYKIIDSYSYYE